MTSHRCWRRELPRWRSPPHRSPRPLRLRLRSGLATPVSGSICDTPGDVGINDSPPPVSSDPYGGEGFLLGGYGGGFHGGGFHGGGGGGHPLRAMSHPLGPAGGPKKIIAQNPPNPALLQKNKGLLFNVF